MKKHYLKTFCLFLLSFIVFSCSSDDSKNEDISQADANAKIENSIVGGKIANIKDGKINLLVSKASINKGIENLIDPVNENSLSYNESKIINIDNSYYLRSLSDNGLVTTTLLEESNNNGNISLLVGGISCTSKACAGTNGCVPAANKKSCTSCLGDCTKNVTSFEPQE
ncbi:hypothetical protein OBK27_13415 [Empedobacter falsenii]